MAKTPENSQTQNKTMALQFLTFPSPLHSHSSLHLSKPDPSSKIPLFLKSRIHHLSRESQIIFRCKPQSNSLAIAKASSLPTETTATEEKEAAVEITDRRKLIAQNIPWTCTAEDIRALFEKHGTVLDVKLSMYNKTRNRGLAFVTMASEEEGTAAFNSLDSYDMDGRTIKIAYSTSLKKDPPAEPQVPTEKYTVYVGNLAWRVTSHDLRGLFSSSGKIVSAKIIYNTKPRRPAGYGFVSFATKEEAEAAISTFNGQEFMGRPLNLGLSKLQTDVVEGTSDEVDESYEASREMSMSGEL